MKNLRMLLIMLAVLVVVGGGAAALLLTMPAREETLFLFTLLPPPQTILETDAEEFSPLSPVENTEDSFRHRPRGRGDHHFRKSLPLPEQSSSAPSSQVEGLESFDIATSSITSGVQTLEGPAGHQNPG